MDFNPEPHSVMRQQLRKYYVQTVLLEQVSLHAIHGIPLRRTYVGIQVQDIFMSPEI